MRKMPAGEFKAKCLKVLDEVQSRRETVTITKRGRAVAKLVPIESGKDPIFGFMQGKIKIKGDVVKPVFSLKEWGNLA